MTLINFKCGRCEEVVTLDTPSNWHTAVHECIECESAAIHHRVWDPPHLGSMSSGEPAR